jgi:hypothetical protein
VDANADVVVIGPRIFFAGVASFPSMCDDAAADEDAMALTGEHGTDMSDDRRDFAR